jgi:hypothetical protein
MIWQMILTYSTGALTGRFGSSSIICDFLLFGQRQPVISPDNRGSTIVWILRVSVDCWRVTLLQRVRVLWVRCQIIIQLIAGDHTDMCSLKLWWLNGIWVWALSGPMHLNLKTGPLCPTVYYYVKVTLFLYQSSRWPLYLLSWYPQGPKRRNPDVHVWVKPWPHTHTKCGLRFPPQHHTSYIWGYYSALLYINVFSRCYVQ